MKAAGFGTSQYTPASPISGAVSEPVHSGRERVELSVAAASDAWSALAMERR